MRRYVFWIKNLANSETHSESKSLHKAHRLDYQFFLFRNYPCGISHLCDIKYFIKDFLTRFSMEEITAYRNFWYLPQPLLSRLSSAYIFKTAKFILSYRFFLCNHLFISLSITQSDQGWTLIVLIKSGERQVRVGCQNGTFANLQKAMEIRLWS